MLQPLADSSQANAVRETAAGEGCAPYRHLPPFRLNAIH
jgi:hypothetical protein